LREQLGSRAVSNARATHFPIGVPASFSTTLAEAEIRAWTEEHYRFSGYVTGFDPCTAQIV